MHEKKKEERSVVVAADTVSYPEAVMVEPFYADLALPAMLGAVVADDPTHFALQTRRLAGEQRAFLGLERRGSRGCERRRRRGRVDRQQWRGIDCVALCVVMEG